MSVTSTSADRSRTTTRDSLAERRNRAVPRGVATATSVFAVKADNATVVGADGRTYIDFAGGIGTLATGHRHPLIIEAVKRQLDAYTHTAFQVMAYEPYIELAERLNALAPFPGPAKSLLLTTGAEAVEAAVKISRVATGRSGIIAFSGAFHGRSQLGMALTGKAAPYKRGLSVPNTDIYRIPFPAPYRGVEVKHSLAALDLLFRTDLEPARVAAIIIEPVQGEGGFHIAPAELLKALRAVCDEHGILLIADEVQSGFGRTGRLFAIEHSSVAPDLVTMGKSLAGGFPLSAVLGRQAIMDQMEPGGLGGTYGGSPVGCAAALAVLDVIEKEQLLARATRLGEVIRERINTFAQRADLRPIANVRGLGAMIAFDLVKARGSGEPDGAAAKAVTARALQHGLVILACGAYGEAIRMLIPLTIPEALLRDGLDALDLALKAA